MAKAGTFGAYQQLSPIRADFGDPMERFADRVIASQDKQRALDAQKRVEKLAMSARLDQELQSFNPAVSGIESVDQINYNAYSNGVQQLGEIHRQMLENPEMANDPNLKLKRANLLNSGKILDAMQKRTTDTYQMLTKGIADGTLSQANMDLLNEMQSYFGVKDPKTGRYTPRYDIRFDDKGLMYTLVETADGRKVRRSVADIINGYEYDPGDLIQTANVSEFVDTYELGKDTELQRTMGGTATVNVFNREGHGEVIEKMLINDQGEPSSMAKSIWVDEMNQNLSDLTPDRVEDVKKLLLDRIEAKADQGVNSFRPDPQGGGSGASDRAHGPGRFMLQSTAQGQPLQVDGKAAFHYRGGVQIDPGKTGSTFDEVYIDQDGNMELRGTYRKKLKGEDGLTGSEDSVEEVSVNTGTPIEQLIGLMEGPNNAVTYYKLEPEVRTDIQSLNKFAAATRVGNAGDLRQMLESQVQWDTPATRNTPAPSTPGEDPASILERYRNLRSNPTVTPDTTPRAEGVDAEGVLDTLGTKPNKKMSLKELGDSIGHVWD